VPAPSSRHRDRKSSEWGRRWLPRIGWEDAAAADAGEGEVAAADAAGCGGGRRTRLGGAVAAPADAPAWAGRCPYVSECAGGGDARRLVGGSVRG